MDAYAQLAAEGYLSLRQGARPRVSDAAAVASEARRRRRRRAAPPRARSTSVPACRTSRRSRGRRGCARCATALATITDADLGYGDPRGVEVLRCALADYLGRVRGVVADPEHIVVTNGYTQGLGLVCHALAAARRASGSRSRTRATPRTALVAARAGLEPVPIGGRRGRNAGRRTRARRRRRGRVDARPPAPHRRRAHRRAANRRCWPGCARPGRDRDRGRLRRRVPLRPRGRRRAPRARPRPRRLRRLGEQDARAGAAASAGWSCRPRYCTRSATRSSSPTAGPPASTSTRSPTS